MPYLIHWMVFIVCIAGLKVHALRGKKKELNQEEQEGQEVLRKETFAFNAFASGTFLSFLVEKSGF